MCQKREWNIYDISKSFVMLMILSLNVNYILKQTFIFRKQLKSAIAVRIAPLILLSLQYHLEDWSPESVFLDEG